MSDGQVETQPALQPLNPHEAVAHIAEAIEAAEKEETRPRDEQGKFAKPQSEEAKPETEASEQTEEQSAEQPQSEDSQEEAQPSRKLKLKYKGEEKEVDEAEAVELAQKGYDYSQKTAQLAQERTELAAKAKEAQESALKQYESQLETYKQIVLKLADQEALTADLAQIAQADPAKALQLSLKRSQIAETLNAVSAEQQRIAQQRQSEFQQAAQKQAREAVEKLQERIPGWNNELYGKILKGSVDTYGFQQQEVSAMTDHRAIEVLHDALKWRESQAKPKTVEKRVVNVPKVVKPGSAEKPNPNADKLKGSMARLKETGSRQDAQDYALQLIESGRI